MKKQNLALVLFPWLVLTTFTSLIFWLVWSISAPYDVFSASSDSWVVQNRNKRVARGSPLLVYLDYCVKVEGPTRMDTLIEQDHNIWLLDTQFPALPIGCQKTTIQIAAIPRVLPIEATTATQTGKAHLRVTLRYRVNAYREVQYNFTTDEFLIDP